MTLRKQGLRSHPLAFGASAEDEGGWTPESVESMFNTPEQSAVFGAVVDDRLAGIVGLRRHGARKSAHRAFIWGMYVDAAARRSGIGRQLLTAAIEEARKWRGVLQVQLTVTEASPEARRLYETFGFRAWGREPRVLCWNGAYTDEHHLVLNLDESFGNVYEDSARAEAYAQLEFPGTYYLAFRDLPDLFRKHVRGMRALDFGCGTGRSSRFLENQGFTTTGVDISAAMLEQARRRALAGDYRLVTARSLGELTERFDLILAAFTFDNIPTNDAKVEALSILRGLLAPGGSVVAVVSTPEIYRHEWASFSTMDFPENLTARDGDMVRTVMLDVPDRRPVDDVLCSDGLYRELFARSGFTVREMTRPLATGREPIAWVSETHTAPWSVYVLGAVQKPARGALD